MNSFNSYTGFFPYLPIKILPSAVNPAQLTGDLIVFQWSTRDFEILISHDGLILLHVVKIEQKYLETDASINDFNSLEAGERRHRFYADYFEHLNVLQLILDSTILELTKEPHIKLSEVHFNNLIRVRINDEGHQHTSRPLMGLTSDLYKELRGQDPSRVFRIKEISQDVLKLVAQRFEQTMSTPDLRSDLAVITKSLIEFKLGNRPVALTLLWLVIERLINKSWVGFLADRYLTFEDGSKRINSDRSKFLEGRDFSASIVSNVLELTEIITHSEFKTIDEIRKARNKVAHSLQDVEIDHQDLQPAYAVATGLIEKTYGFKIVLNPQVYSHHT